MSNLAFVGLAVCDEAEMDALFRDIEPDSRSLARVGGIDVRRWEVPAGSRLVCAVRRDEVIDFLPSFAASPGARLADIRLVSDEVASVAIVDEHGAQETAMTLALEQRRLVRARGAPKPGRVAIVALGVGVAVFDDTAAFGQSPGSFEFAEDSEK